MLPVSRLRSPCSIKDAILETFSPSTCLQPRTLLSDGWKGLNWSVLGLGLTIGSIVLFFVVRWVARIVNQHRKHRTRSEDERRHQRAEDQGKTEKSTNLKRTTGDMIRLLFRRLRRKPPETDYHQWFWNPHGDLWNNADEHVVKSHTWQFITEWLVVRKVAPLFACADAPYKSSRKLEEGQPRSFQIQDPLHLQYCHVRREDLSGDSGTDSISSVVMSGALTCFENTGKRTTVQHSRLRYYPPKWSAISSEVHRTKNTQLVKSIPSLDISVPVSARRAVSCLQAKRDSTINNLKTTYLQARWRILSMPENDIRQSKHCTSKTENLSSLKLYRRRGSRLPGPPSNSEDTSNLTMLHPRRDFVRLMNANNTLGNETSALQYNQDLGGTLQKQLKRLVSPVSLNKVTSIGGPKCGTAESRVTPFVLSTAQVEYANNLFDKLSSYEVQGSMDGESSSQFSSVSTRMEMLQLGRYRELWCSGRCQSKSQGLVKCEKGMPHLPMSGIQPEEAVENVVQDDGPNTGSVSTFRRLQRSCDGVDRGISVSVSSDFTAQRIGIPQTSRLQYLERGYRNSARRATWSNPRDLERKSQSDNSKLSSELPIRTFKTGRARGKENPLSHHQDVDFPSHHTSVKHQSISASSQHHSTTVFARDLRSRLGRLAYEVSPGFRGSPDGFCSTQPKACFNARRMSSPAAFMHFSGNVTKSKKSLTGTPAAKYGDIDTAAWMLPQRPQGVGSGSETSDMLFTGGFGVRRTLAEWQARSLRQSRKRSSARADRLDPPVKSAHKAREKRNRGGWVTPRSIRGEDLDGGVSETRTAEADSWRSCSEREVGELLFVVPPFYNSRQSSDPCYCVSGSDSFQHGKENAVCSC